MLCSNMPYLDYGRQVHLCLGDSWDDALDKSITGSPLACPLLRGSLRQLFSHTCPWLLSSPQSQVGDGCQSRRLRNEGQRAELLLYLIQG